MTDVPGGQRTPLIVTWLVVLLPALWGIAQTIQKSSMLFR